METNDKLFNKHMPFNLVNLSEILVSIICNCHFYSLLWHPVHITKVCTLLLLIGRYQGSRLRYMPRCMLAYFHWTLNSSFFVNERDVICCSILSSPSSYLDLFYFTYLFIVEDTSSDILYWLLILNLFSVSRCVKDC